jgi:hypothetical protein
MLPIALLAAATTVPAAGPPRFDPTVDGERLVVLCDPARFRFSIRAEADAASVDRSYPERRVIATEALFAPAMLPGWSGSPDFLAPQVRYERCGPYTLKLEGDAFNLNVQGESGAYPPFARVMVLRAGGPVQRPAGAGALSFRLTSCDPHLPRSQPCPGDTAVRLDAHYDARGKRLVAEWTAELEDLAGDGTAHALRPVREAIEDDLSGWIGD